MIEHHSSESFTTLQIWGGPQRPALWLSAMCLRTGKVRARREEEGGEDGGREGEVERRGRGFKPNNSIFYIT